MVFLCKGKSTLHIAQSSSTTRISNNDASVEDWGGMIARLVAC
jgi:hypothetical protein